MTAGIEPRSRRPHEPNFDLAWTTDGAVFVAEIKSITEQNEEEQLRLGLGQVLRYRHRLDKLGHQHVLAVLVPEREPRDPSWRDLCDELGVIMLSRRRARPRTATQAHLGCVRAFEARWSAHATDDRLGSPLLGMTPNRSGARGEVANARSSLCGSLVGLALPGPPEPEQIPTGRRSGGGDRFTK